MPWEETITGETVFTMSGQEPDPVSPLKLNVHAASCCDETVLPGSVWVQDQLSVAHQIHTTIELVDCTVELELVNTGVLACEIPGIDVIAVLSIVDDITKDDGLVGIGEVVSKSHRESNFFNHARRSRGASLPLWSSGSCVGGEKEYYYAKRIFPLQYFRVISDIDISFYGYGTGSGEFTWWSSGTILDCSYRKIKGKNQPFQNTRLALGQLCQRVFQDINSPSSLHGLRSNEGMSLHLVYPDPRGLYWKGLSGTSVIPVLSQMIRASDVSLRDFLWSAVKTPSFSHQSL